MSHLNILSQSMNGINNVSYLNSKENSLFSVSSSKEYFFGSSDNDIVEVGIYNDQSEIVSFMTMVGSHTSGKTFYKYEDVDGNTFVDYYFPITSNFIQDPDKNLLVSIPDIVVSQSITSHNFGVSLTPISNIFSKSGSLIIKEISNSRTELRLMKSFTSETVNDIITVTFSKGKTLFNGKTEISLRSGIVHTLRVIGDVHLVKFSLVKDGVWNGGLDFFNNIIYNASLGEISIDTTEDFPNALFTYNPAARDLSTTISFVDRVSDDVFRLNTEFLSLKSGNFINKRIHENVEYYLNIFSTSSEFNLSKDDNRRKIDSLKKLYVLTDDGGVINIIKSIYYGEDYYDAELKQTLHLSGIKDYIFNYLKFNFEFINNFQSIRKSFDNINFNTCKKRLGFYNPNVIVPTGNVKNEYTDSLEYLVSLFGGFLESVISTIEQEYINKFQSPLKNSLNFGSGKFSIILNSKMESDDVILVKIKESLPNNYSVGDLCDISNISVSPFFQNITFEVKNKSSTIKIGNPNFSLDINEPSGRTIGTKYYTSSDLNYGRSISNKVSINKKLIDLNVDYSSFSNFVIFSSANLRVKIFENKISRITVLEEEIVSLTAFDPSYSTINDKLNVYNKIKADEEEIDSIILGFDGYESYLYKTGAFVYDTTDKIFVENSGSSAVSSYVTDLESESIDYDKDNRDSLINNTPEYIFENEDNDEYLKFLSMVGHHFDNIYLYISSIGVYKKVGYDIDSGLTGHIVSHILNSFGFNVPPGLTGLNESIGVADNYLSFSDHDSVVTSISTNEKTKTIWKRVLLNLPLIYKTKGTTECLRTIFAIYGIPNNLILLKEFGGGYTQPNISSSYLIEEKVNLLEFSGSNDYIVTSNFPTYNSLDFKLYVNSNAYKSTNTLVPIHNKFGATGTEIYSFGFIKLTKTLGSLYFIIKSATDSFVKVTDPISMFNEEIMSVMIRKNDVDSNFEEAADLDVVPTKYDICVHTNSQCFSDVDNKFSFYLSGSLNSSFNEEGFSTFGNVGDDINIISEFGNVISDQIEALFVSESVDDEIVSESDTDGFVSNLIGGYNVSSFYGCMDKFVFQSAPLSDHNLYLKCKNFNYYSQGESSSSYSDIIYRFDMKIPIDIIHSSSQDGGYVVENSNKNYPSYYSTLFNFTGSNIENTVNTSSCVSESYSYFPHQTKEFQITNEYFTQEIGPNRFENDKVKYNPIYTLDDTLSPLSSRATKHKTNFYRDSNKLGIFLSPIHERNRDILDFFGDGEIITSISDPRDRFGRKYIGLETLRQNYYGDNYIQRILFNELFTIYKLYVDKSIFDTLKNVLPVRTKIYQGLLIEPTILERSRVENKPVFVGEIEKIESAIGIQNIIADDSALYIPQLNSEITLDAVFRHVSHLDYSFGNFECIKDSPDEFMTNIFVGENGYVERDGQIYSGYNVSDLKTITYLDNGVSKNVDRHHNRVELVLSGSNSVIPLNYERMEDNRHSKHISRKHIPTRKTSYYVTGSLTNDLTEVEFFTKSRQTKFTTINESGQENREPIISTVVGTSIKNTNGIVSR